jgi:hypothetical protein
MSLLLGANAGATLLEVTFVDPVGDQSPIPTIQIDLVRTTLEFDNATGAYEIFFQADPAHPFLGFFVLNANLLNGDISPLTVNPSMLRDTLNTFDLTVPATMLTLSGTNVNLLSWKAGDRVATSSGPFGVPIDTTFPSFLSGVSFFGMGLDPLPDGPLDYSIVVAQAGEPATLLLLGVGLATFLSSRTRRVRQFTEAELPVAEVATGIRTR